MAFKRIGNETREWQRETRAIDVTTEKRGKRGLSSRVPS